jgi:mycobactin peptide synthetase MbtE
MSKKLIHTLFEQQACNNPQRVAVQETHRSISYGELDAKANRLAHLLRQMGIGRDSIVGVMIPGGSGLVLAMLAAFKSGGVYLPIDPAFSPKRLLQIFSLSRPDVLIVSEAQQVQVLKMLNELQIAPPALIALDEDFYFSGNINAATAAPEWINDPDDGNYLFYTSGSTGEAKSFMGRHQSLSHFIHWEIKEFNITESCRVSQLSQFTFDASLRDIFLPLSCGGTLCIPDADIKSNIVKLIGWIEEMQLSLIHCVPSLFRLISKELQQQQKKNAFPELRYVLMAGEPLYAKDIQLWRETVGEHVEIVNLYGTSETTLAKTFHRIGAIDGNPSQALHVGKPIDNAAVLILNDGIPCAAGEVGEIYIRTPFMTKGYYKNDALNAEAFIQNPLVEYRDLMHKTGDLGRFTPEGNIDVLGRTDDQVKVNGIRVTLGEIKQAVLDVAGVREAEIIVRQNDGQENELLCYYTGNTNTDDLQAQLRLSLNANVLPAFFIKMEQFPLTINGKVDKKALPQPLLPVVNAGDEAPAGEVEQDIAGMWSELLGADGIGRNTSFFKIGGTSLKAIQLISRVYKKYQVLIKVNDIFANATIAQLAAFIGGKQQKSDDIVPVKEQAGYDVTHAQKRLWMIDQLQGEKAAYNIPGAFLLKGALNIPALEQAFQSLIERHEALRSTFMDVNGTPKFKINNTADLGFKIDYVDLSADPFARQTAAIMAREIFNTPFDLERGPLMNAALLQTAAYEYVFVLTMHHIISDGWSIQVMVKELLALYNSFAQAKPNPLPALKLQYKDYAAWLNKRLSGGDWEKLRQYWLGRFEEDVPVLELPVDYPRPAVKTTNGAVLEFDIPASLTEDIKALVRSQEASMYMFVLAGVKLLLFHYSGQEDIVVGSPIAGRVHKDLDEQVGLYVNLLAIRTRLDLSASLQQLLKQIKTNLLSAYEHQLFPFDQLVKELNLEHDNTRSPLTDVWVQHSDTPWVQVNDEQLAATPFDAGHYSSKVDLTFKFTESNGKIAVILEYNTDLFKESSIRGIKQDLLQLMELAVQQADAPLKAWMGKLNEQTGKMAALAVESISTDY